MWGFHPRIYIKESMNWFVTYLLWILEHRSPWVQAPILKKKEQFTLSFSVPNILAKYSAIVNYSDWKLEKSSLQVPPRQSWIYLIIFYHLKLKINQLLFRHFSLEVIRTYISVVNYLFFVKSIDERKTLWTEKQKYSIHLAQIRQIWGFVYQHKQTNMIKWTFLS